MRGGPAGWIALSLILLPIAACGGEVSLFIDGEPAGFSSPLIVSDGTLYAPLVPFAPRVGVEAVRTPDGGEVNLRWDGGKGRFQAEIFPIFDGELYVSVDWLVSLLGGSVHRIGDERHVETDIRYLDDVEATDGEVILRFDGFVPQETIAEDEDTVRIRFYHSRMRIPPRSFLLAEGRISRVDIAPADPDGCQLTLTLRSGGEPWIRRTAEEGFYSVSIRIGDEAYLETETALESGFTVHEVRTVMSGGKTDIVYLSVTDWRRDYRLRPGISTAGVGEPSAISDIARTCGASAAIGAGSELRFFVLGGIPYALEPAGAHALGFDLFGRPSVFSPSVSVALRCDGERIPIDGANRPILYGEAVAFSPGYTREIARGVPGSFLVIKLRDGRVVSVYEGPFVAADPTAPFIVVSGGAKARFSSVSLGDRAEIVTHRLDGAEVIDAIGIVGILIDEGIDLSSALADALGPAADTLSAWSVVCTDWYGGLILLSVIRGGGSAGASLSDLSTYLRSLPVPIKDGFVLSLGRSGGLIYSDSGVYDDLVSGEPVISALCLVPIGR